MKLQTKLWIITLIVTAAIIPASLAETPSAEIIKKYEGFKGQKYKCPAGVETIGYGFTSLRRSSMSRKEADIILEEKIRETEIAVLTIVEVDLTLGQLTALTSFTYNLGEGSLRKLVNGPNRLNSGNYKSVEEILPKYVYAGGKKLNGLVKRRNEELQYWKGEK